MGFSAKRAFSDWTSSLRIIDSKSPQKCAPSPTVFSGFTLSGQWLGKHLIEI
jgi:hypothetical protein